MLRRLRLRMLRPAELIKILDRSERRERRLHHLLDLGAHGDVAGEDGRALAARAERGARLLELGAIAAHERHPRAGLGEREGDRAADAAAGAHDECGVILNTHVASLR
ncbi:MAG: hypothetical protein QM820_53995 [Minicystis sp.]